MHFLILLVLLFLSGCSNQGLNDAEAPKILGVSIDTNYSCTKGGTEVPCLLNSVPADTTTVKVRIIGSDDIGIAGYYILNEDSVIPPDWTTVAPAETTYDKTVTHYLPPGDGIKKVQVWIKDLGGKISDSTTAEVLVVSGQVKEWEKESIDEQSDFGNGLFIHALRADSNGSPHIVFGENEIYHAVSDSNGWSIEKLEGIDTGGAFSYAGTVLDSSGNVHLSYIDGNKNLVYATNSSGVWAAAIVDSFGHASGIPDIDYGIGGIHISYYDAGGRDLKYANCVSDCTDIVNWKMRTVDDTGDVGIHSSIKAGTDGSVHISYFDNTNNTLKYVTADKDGLWGTPVSIDPDCGGYSDIALGQDNRPHIVYYDSSGILKYASDVSGNWEKAELDTDSITANFLSISVDAGNILHISYHDTKSKSLKYASNSSGLWKITSIDSNGTAGLYNLISTDSNNRVHISYFDSYSKAVKYAVCTGSCTDISNWKIERVLSSGDAGRYNSMVTDSDGNVHVSYLGGGELRYAENTTGIWRTAVVDDSGSSGEYSSIAIDSAGIIHIAYYDNDKNGLKYAVCNNNCVKSENWIITIIDTGLNSVSFSHVSLTADTDAGLHISYYDNTTGSLKYAFCNTGCTTDNNWKKVFVDVSVTVNNNVLTDVGQYSSIAVDKSSNKVYISYFDEISGSLLIAGCISNCSEDSDSNGIGDNWTREQIDTGKKETVSGSIDSRGKYTSVKVDNDGDVHISYFNETTGDLKYATNKSNDWVFTVIDKYDRAGIYTALSIGTDNKVYIAYFRYSVGLSVLKYAVCSLTLSCTSDNVDNITRSPETDGDGVADNWDTYILDMFDNPGMFASVTADNGIHVIYYNPDTGGLDYLRQ